MSSELKGFVATVAVSFLAALPLAVVVEFVPALHAASMRSRVEQPRVTPFLSGLRMERASHVSLKSHRLPQS
jgi:hypothetical protein